MLMVDLCASVLQVLKVICLFVCLFVCLHYSVYIPVPILPVLPVLRCTVPGERCEFVISPCESDPCLHGATCTDHGQGYTCICPDTYRGDRCQYRIQIHDPGKYTAGSQDR